jgi:hypothetical protein
MLNVEAFEVWCLQHHLSEQAKIVVQRIRSSPPSRLVRGAAGNVSGRYPSVKLGCTIQFESHRGELAFMYQMEHDAAVLEFYDQPEPIKLIYTGKTGKPVGIFHTPDFFVLRSDGAILIEPGLVLQGRHTHSPLGCFTAVSLQPRSTGSTNAISVFSKTTSVFPALQSKRRWQQPFVLWS